MIGLEYRIPIPPGMEVFVPFDVRDPKRRLEPLFSADERRAFARAMLTDVLAAVSAAGHEPTVLATAPVDVDADIEVDDRPLTPAVNARLTDRSPPVAVVMADLPLLTPAVVGRLFDSPGDVVLAPGLGGGTNAVVARSPVVRVDYHGASIRDHRRMARMQDLRATTVDSYRVGVDVDEPSDLVEVLIHARGASRDWLEDHGVCLLTDDRGRVRVDRRPLD